MSIRAKLMEDLKTAMKEKNQSRLDTIRFVQAAIKNREIEVRPNSITEDDVLTVLKKLAKQRKESIEQFEKADRKDLADKEKSELVILEEYLPKAPERGQIEAVVNEVIKTLNASSIKDMGAVMKESQARFGGAADNKTLSEIIRSKLS